MTSLPLTALREHFPILTRRDRHGQVIAYLDNAASTQQPQSVIERINAYQQTQHANVHRGVHTLASEATTAYEHSRDRVRDFIHAANRREIIFTGGATAGINLVAQTFGRQRLRQGGAILISILEHHANFVPWQQLCLELGAELRVIPLLPDGSLDQEVLQKQLRSDVRLLALSHISNSLGTINPIREIIAQAHAKGIPVLIDAAQSVATYPIDVQMLDCDFLVFSGHKMYGPTGVGVLYGKLEHLQQMPPWQYGGEMIRSVRLQGTTFADPPQRFEAGTPPIAQAVGLAAAIDFIQTVGQAAMRQRSNELSALCTHGLSQIEGVRIIGQAPDKSSIVSFVMENVHPHDMATILNEAGVAVRAGHHCTQPLMEALGLPGTVRASFAAYNTAEEVDRLLAGVQDARRIFHI